MEGTTEYYLLTNPDTKGFKGQEVNNNCCLIFVWLPCSIHPTYASTILNVKKTKEMDTPYLGFLNLCKYE